jgi:hypothetical protein
VVDLLDCGGVLIAASGVVATRVAKNSIATTTGLKASFYAGHDISSENVRKQALEPLLV